MTALKVPFGKRWGVGYGPGETDAVCGYFMNPDAPAIHLVRWCNQPATYGFLFKPGPEDDIFVSLGGWNAACAEHAAIVRSHGEIAAIWWLPRTITQEDA